MDQQNSKEKKLKIIFVCKMEINNVWILNF